jgi:hypothetical protein
MYILVDLGFKRRKLIELSPFLAYKSILTRLRAKGYNPRIVHKPPSSKTLRRWTMQGKARAICGCWLNDALCGSRCKIHNTMSWITIKEVVINYEQKR